MAIVSCEKLIPFRLPKHTEFIRNYEPIEEANRPDDFLDKYDLHTLFYGYWWGGDRIMLFCPKLYNLAFVVRKVFSDAGLADVRIHQYPRWDLVEASVSTERKEIQFIWLESEYTIYKQSAAIERKFNNLKCLVTVQKNNNLRWIKDWANYYQRYHDVEGVLIFNNQSDIYSLDELCDCLADTDLKHAHIVDVDLPYGPTLINRDQSKCFLQTALLNYARFKFLRLAKKVISVDIDELLTADNAKFQFGFKLWGFARAKGYWVFPYKGANEIVHASHNLQNRKAMKAGHKYFYSPRSLPEWVMLDVHGLEVGSTILRKLIHALSGCAGYSFNHYFGLSTNWKGIRFNSKMKD